MPFIRSCWNSITSIAIVVQLIEQLQLCPSLFIAFCCASALIWAQLLLGIDSKKNAHRIAGTHNCKPRTIGPNEVHGCSMDVITHLSIHTFCLHKLLLRHEFSFSSTTVKKTVLEFEWPPAAWPHRSQANQIREWRKKTIYCMCAKWNIFSLGFFCLCYCHSTTVFRPFVPQHNLAM